MMLPKELCQVLKLSGGKVIVSEGDIEESYVVMSLSEYLKEKEKEKEQERPDEKGANKGIKSNRLEFSGDGLTNEALLDRINADIAELRQRKNEIELQHELEGENGEKEEDSDIRYEEVR